MANTLRFKRGLVAGIPTGVAGEPLFTTDTFDLYIGNGTTNTRFQKYIASGTTLQYLRGDGSLATFPTDIVTGTGVSGQVAYWSGTNTQVGSANLVWDNSGARLGIGRTPTARRFEIQVGNGGLAAGIGMYDGAGSLNNIIGIDTVTTNDLQIAAVTGIRFYSGSVLGNVVTMPTNERMRLWGSTGNLAIGGTFASDTGQRLQVNGDTLLKGSGNTSATTALQIQNSSSSNLFRLFNNGEIIFGTSGSSFFPTDKTSFALSIAGSGYTFYDGSQTTGTFVRITGNNITDTGGASFALRVQRNFVPSSSNGTFVGLGVENTINQTGGANGITRGLYVNPTLTAAADWRSIETSNNTGWSYYGAGSANSYFNGSVGIGINSLTGYNLRVLKNITSSTFGVNVSVGGAAQSDVTNSATYFQAISSTQATTFTLPQIYLYTAQQGTFGAGSTVTEQIGFFASSSLIGATTNYGFYGLIAAGTNRWNLYMGGTAANFLSGNTQIGTGAFTSEKLQVNGTMKVTGDASVNGVTVGLGGGAQVGNVAVGSQAMLLNTTGGGNTAFGHQALRNNTTQYYNTAIGERALRSSVADKNTALGSQAMEYSTSGGNNTSVGHQSLYFTLGSSNVALGDQAGKFITSGAAYNASCNNSIFIGQDTRAAANGQTNQIVVGFNTIGNGSNTATWGNTSITNHYFTGAATFSSSVTAKGGQNAGGYFINVTGVTALTRFNMGSSIAFLSHNYNIFSPASQDDVAIPSWYIPFGGGSGADYFRINRSAAGSTTMTTLLGIDGTGAATFSSTLTTGGNILLGASASTIGAINFIKTGTSPVASRLTFGTDGTGYSFAIGKNQAGTVTDLFSIADSGAANFTTSIQAGTAIAIGTTPDTNKPFKILKNINAGVGINFENTSVGANAFSVIQMGTDVTGGTKFTNLVYSSSGVTANGVYNPDGTSLINNGGGGLNFLGTPTRFYTGGSTGVLRLYLDNNGLTQLTATTPTTSETDGYRQYSADVVAGNAAPHFRTENGAVVKIYQETTGVGNAIFSAGGGTGVLDDSTFDGYTLRQIVKALRNQGILA